MISDENKRAVELMHGDLKMSAEEIAADFRLQNLPMSLTAVKNICAEMKGRRPKTRKSHLIEFRGLRMPICEWSEITGISAATISKRIEIGWDVASALTTPVRRFKKNRSQYVA